MEARRVVAVDRQSNELLNWLQRKQRKASGRPEPEQSRMTRNRLRQQGISSPFPVSPRGKPGREGVPPRRKHATSQQKALARIDAAGSPLKRAAAPLWIPCERGGAELGPVRTNRMFWQKEAENQPMLENRFTQKT
jgi:hypothetical protein